MVGVLSEQAKSFIYIGTPDWRGCRGWKNAFNTNSTF